MFVSSRIRLKATQVWKNSFGNISLFLTACKVFMYVADFLLVRITGLLCHTEILPPSLFFSSQNAFICKSNAWYRRSSEPKCDIWVTFLFHFFLFPVLKTTAWDNNVQIHGAKHSVPIKQHNAPVRGHSPTYPQFY